MKYEDQRCHRIPYRAPVRKTVAVVRSKGYGNGQGKEIELRAPKHTIWPVISRHTQRWAAQATT